MLAGQELRAGKDNVFYRFGTRNSLNSEQSVYVHILNASIQNLVEQSALLDHTATT